MTPAPVESINRAVLLLEKLSEAGPEGVALAHLCRELGMNKSTAYRALNTMRTRGFVEQNPNGDYQLGPTAIGMSRRWFSAGSLTEQLHPALVAIARELGELTHLGVLSGDRVVYIDKVEPEKPIRVWSQVGRAVPAANTALGRAILSQRGLTDRLLTCFITDGQDPTRLLEAVAEARLNGFSTEVQENEPGIACIGVPILGNDHAIAAMSVTMLAEALDEASIRRATEIITRVVPPLLPSSLHLPTALLAHHDEQHIS